MGVADLLKLYGLWVSLRCGCLIPGLVPLWVTCGFSCWVDAI